MGRLQAHCSPLQAPPLEYQCSSSGNSSRTAIREKNNSIVLQEDKRATADLCRMTVTTQRARQFTASTKHNYIVFTGRHVPHIMHYDLQMFSSLPQTFKRKSWYLDLLQQNT